MDDRSSLYACVSAILVGILLSFELHFPTSIPNIYSDITSFWGRSWVSSGQIPYTKSFFEYPTISGLILYAARKIGGNLIGYYEAFGAFSAVAAGIIGWSSWSIAKSVGKRLSSTFFLMPSIIIYGIYNFDLFHIMFILLSLQALLIKRNSLSGVALGLAIATKLTSVVLIPVYLLEIQGRRERIKFFAILVVLVLAINAPFMIYDFSLWFQTFTFIRNWGLEDAWYVWIFQNPASWGYAKYFGLGITGLLLVRTYALKADLMTKSFLALTAYLLGTYIYSPQFNLLLIPIVAILALDHPSVYLWDGFNALIILTWFLQPNSTLAGTIPQVFALLRAGGLAWMSLVLLRRVGALDPWLQRISVILGRTGRKIEIPQPLVRLKSSLRMQRE